ncbi:MAG: heme-binding domain-containing protein [Ignavibacteriaceae bacterium]
MKALKIIVTILVLVFIGIQFIPVDRENPPVDKNLSFKSPENVLKVLKKSCYDCHSYETKWPWYSYIAPASFLVANDVKEGRKHLNFSRWNFYFPEDQDEYKEEIWEEVSSGNMPMSNYLMLHSEAELTEEDLKILKEWTQGKESGIKFTDENDK